METGDRRTHGWVGVAVLAALVAAATLLGRYVLFAVVLAVAVVVTGELFRIARARGVTPLPLVGLGGVVGLLAAAVVRGERAPAALAGAISAIVVAAFVALIVRSARTDAVRALFSTLVPVLVVGFLGAYVLAIRGAPQGIRLVLALLAIVGAAEAAIVLARAVALRRRLVPALLGGCVGALVVGAAFSPTPSVRAALLIAVVLAPIIAASDAMAELVERSLGPDGMARRALLLRRVDGVLFAAPAFFYLYRVLAR